MQPFPSTPRPLRPRLWLTLALPLCVASTARGQAFGTVWPTVAGTTEAVAAGDVDGDGQGDFLIGAGAEQSGTPGTITIRSGATNAVVRTHSGLASNDAFGGRALELGDVDHDGHDDYLAAATVPVAALGGRTYVRAFSGATGALLWHVDSPDGNAAFGTDLARGPDVDLDGALDVVVGAPSPVGGGPGKVYVVSGASGSILRTLVGGAASSSEFGRSVARTGDFDADGRSDLLVGDPAGGPVFGGQVTVHSSASGAVLRTFATTVTDVSFGAAVASLGDLDGDAVADVAIGAPFELHGQFRSGRVRIVSGAAGTVLRTIDEAAQFVLFFGGRLSSYADVDGDGRRDLAVAEGMRHVGCCTNFAGDMIVYSSATGVEVERHVGLSARFALVRDLDGDAREEFLVSQTYVSGSIFGVGLFLSGVAYPEVDATCVAKVNSLGATPQIASLGAPSLTIGPVLTVTATNVLGGTIGLFAFAKNGATTPFGGGMLCVAPPIARGPVTSTGGTAGASNGTLSHAFSRAQLATLGYGVGSSLHVQAWYRDGGFPPSNAIGLSGAIVATVWP